MSVRSLNKVMLIGNLTRDPNLRFTPNNTAVCSFGLATNRSWATDAGEKQEQVEYHNIVAWSKLADICGQLLHKGDKVFVEGRLQTRDWKGDDGQERRTTEIVIDNMILLRSSGQGSNYVADDDDAQASTAPPAKSTRTSKKTEPAQEDAVMIDDISDDIPF